MYINPKSIIAGQAAIKVRNFLRRTKDRPFSIRSVCYFLKVSKQKGNKIVRILLENDYIEPDNHYPKGPWWKTTLKGNSLSLASAARPLHRSTADRKINEFLDRVRIINNDDYYLYCVTKVIVFGSYLSQEKRINDIDLAVELHPKDPDIEKHIELEDNRLCELTMQGRHFSNIVDKLFCARQEVLRFLKSRSRAIGLHETSDQILMRTKLRILYKDTT